MKVYCPRHPNEMLRPLGYQVLNREKLKLGKRQGQVIYTDHFLCLRCNKTYKPKVSFK